MLGFANGTHKSTQTERCADNLQKIFLAAQIYDTDCGVFPKSTNAQTSEDVLTKLVPRYSSDTSIFTCPGTHDPEIPSASPLGQYKISYTYYMGRNTNSGPSDCLMSDRQINTLSKNIGDQVFSLTGEAPGNNHSKSGGNILFCDGSVQQTSPQAAFSLAFSNSIVLLNPKP
jgi:prepilin-type processing-associated H-X9-DG protein